jgi:CubicO group peptidase (beta-lactamase class C family)
MRFLFVLLATLALSFQSNAQGLTTPDPAASLLSARGIGALDSVMRRYSEQDRFPGVMLMVARDGKVAYWKAFGVRDLESRTPLDRTDVFRIFSLTKPVTVTAVLMLMEQGKLALDDPAEKYVPVLAKLQVINGPGRTRPQRQPLTIRHLLTFTSGFSYGIFPPFGPADAQIREADVFGRSRNLNDAMDRIAVLPLVSDPGAGASYGWQMDVLGKIVESVSGMPLDRFFEQRIFAPLKMRETAFMIPSSALPRVPTLYSVESQKAPVRAAESEWYGAYGQPPRVLWGGGGLVSTAADYVRFAQMIANKGELDGVRLLRAPTIEMMTTPQVPVTLPGVEERLGKGLTFGFGTMVATDIAAAGGGGHDGLYYFAGAGNLFVWTDRQSGIVGLLWAQSVPFQVYPAFFADVRRAVAEAVGP